ncbi:MAG TPA: Mth938-like domain-containing protein [Xanthomonadaceae bacterium]|nr:Mth938-like domain-containing protein [Xanthomonadaceae bacterium]
MELTLDRSGGHHLIRATAHDWIRVDERRLCRSFVLMPDRLEDWPPTTAAGIDAAHLDQLLALAPELIVLGTGARQVFLPARLQARVLARGVGLEVMGNDAAARTYNVLAAERRRVLAAFVLPG